MSGEERRRESGSSPLMGNVIRWIATTAGLSGLLATTGYIVHFSQEDLLGISLDTRSSAAAFALDGARFFTDLGVFVLSAAPGLMLAVLAVAIFLLLVATIRWVVRKSGRRLSRTRIPAWVYPSLLLLAVVGELAWDDLPTMYIQNVLFRPVQVGSDIGLSQNLPTPLKIRTTELRNAVICSRAELPGCQGNTSSNKRYLERWFSYNFVLTLFFLIFGLRALTTQPSDHPRAAGRLTPILSPLGIFLSLALFLNLFGIPFVYAKTIKPTRFMDAEIVFKKSGGAKPLEAPSSKLLETSASKDGNIVNPTVANGANEKPAVPEDEPLAATLSLTHWYILSEDSDRLTLYNQDRTQIWSIPKADLQVIEIVGEGDVLETHFLEWYKNYNEESEDGNKT